MITKQQTVWTLIPRGYYKETKKPLFTVFVSPWMADMNSEPALADTCWPDWYDRISEVISSHGKSFLKLAASDGTTATLTLSDDMPYPQAGAGADAATKELLEARRELWVELTQTPLPHVTPATSAAQAANAEFTLASFSEREADAVPPPIPPGPQWNSNVLSSNPIPPSTQSLASQAAKFHALAHSDMLRLTTGKKARAGGGRIPLAPLGAFSTTLANLSHQEELEKFIDSKQESVDMLRFTLEKDERPNPTLNTEIQHWIATANAGRMLAATTLKRDLYRLSDAPYDSLKPSVLWYLYQKRATQADSNFLAAGDYSAYQTEASQKGPFIEGVTFHRRIPTEATQPAPALTRLPSKVIPAVWRTIGGADHPYLPYLDFLQVLAMLGHYPGLLYCLGLAFDVTAESASWSSETRVSVAFAPEVADALGATRTGKQPKVVVRKQVYPDDSPSPAMPVKNGFLQMDEYEACTYDADGDTLRRHANAESPARVDDDDVATSWKGLLPRRSAGIAIVHKDHPKMLVSHVRTQQDKRIDPGSELYANDLVRGFSPEVLAETGWVSLTARTEDYQYKGKSLLGSRYDRPHTPINLEACFAHDAVKGESPVHDPHIGTAVVRWSGWSLALPLPFAGLRGPNDVNPPTQSAEYPITSVYQRMAGAKYPRLRCGGQNYRRKKISKYSLRVPALDLMGNPIAIPAGTPDPSALTTDYLRHDPIPAPEPLADPDFDPQIHFGEQINLMAVRDGDADYQPTRYLCPPVAGLLALVEQGAFDVNEKEPLLSPYRVGSFNDVELNEYGNLASKQIGEPPSANKPDDRVTVPVYRPPKRARSGAYLPDLFAQYAKILLEDAVTGRLFGPLDLAPFYEEFDHVGNINNREWPHAVHLRVKLEPAADDSHPTLYTRWELATLSTPPNTYRLQLRISIPKGWQVKMLLSCAPDSDQVKRMDCDGDSSTLVANGLSPLHTPTRLVKLVHAVSKPLADSYFDPSVPPQLACQADSSIAGVSGNFQVGDGRSTGLCVVTMEWEEYIDNPALPAPKIVRHAEALVQIPNVPMKDLGNKRKLADQEAIPKYYQHALDIPNATTYKFADGKYRQICFGVTALSRFQNFFEAPPQTPNTGSANSNYARQAIDHPLVPVDKKNTRLPDPVSLSHILPLLPVKSVPRTTTLASRGAKGNLTVRSTGFRRYGGAFRIHLRRGWYSSGAGEQLGIVLVGDDLVACKKTTWEANPLLSNLFTRWGPDPVWSADVLPDDFTAAPTSADFLPPTDLKEFTSPSTVALQPHELANHNDTTPSTIVTYNPVFNDRDGWYADVILKNVRAYNTFLRLALVRYQAQSVDDRKLSFVTLSPFIQVHPDRAVWVIRGQEKHSFYVGIYGLPSGLDANKRSATTEVVVEVEHSEIWSCDQDVSCAPCPPSETGLATTLHGDPLPLLATYLLKVAKHTHRRRRVRVNEFEMRTGYNPETLTDSAPSPFWTNFGSPIELP
jgi:hypothetical protein